MVTVQVVARDSPSEPCPHDTTRHLVASLRGRAYPITCPADPEDRAFLRRMAEATEQRRAERADFAITVATMCAVLAVILLLYWAVAPEVLPSIGVVVAVAFTAAFTDQFRKRRTP
ncbi:cell division protein ZapA [Actinokineospora terrae]|uniref:Uncharacterized protein n=1 Tax=Actinokineospora terrae TaxID=155974 RepID=A0A1H9SJD6_9PSEU|nr:cell division protein ZapA [Actinokineospora terrae]SER85074.1 hypothetical protein SAMN04487818_105491 [Actinokineospora terrae]